MEDQAEGTVPELPGGAAPARLALLLASEAAVRGMPPPERRRALARLDALRQSLDRRTCSSAWLADCWEGGAAFPPPADTTPMRPCRCERCRAVGRLWPGQYVAPDRLQGRSPTLDEPTAPPRHTGGGTPADDKNLSPGTILSYECHLESLSDWEAAQLPSSPSGLAMRAVREGRVKLRRQRTRIGGGRRFKA